MCSSSSGYPTMEEHSLAIRFNYLLLSWKSSSRRGVLRGSTLGSETQSDHLQFFRAVLPTTNYGYCEDKNDRASNSDSRLLERARCLPPCFRCACTLEAHETLKRHRRREARVGGGTETPPYRSRPVRDYKPSSPNGSSN